MLPDLTMMMPLRVFKLFSSKYQHLVSITLVTMMFQYLTKSKWSSDYDVIINVIVNWICPCEFSICPNSVTTPHADIDLWWSLKFTGSYYNYIISSLETILDVFGVFFNPVFQIQWPCCSLKGSYSTFKNSLSENSFVVLSKLYDTKISFQISLNLNVFSVMILSTFGDQSHRWKRMITFLKWSNLSTIT